MARPPWPPRMQPRLRNRGASCSKLLAEPRKTLATDTSGRGVYEGLCFTPAELEAVSQRRETDSLNLSSVVLHHRICRQLHFGMSHRAPEQAGGA